MAGHHDMLLAEARLRMGMNAAADRAAVRALAGSMPIDHRPLRLLRAVLAARSGRWALPEDLLQLCEDTTGTTHYAATSLETLGRHAVRVGEPEAPRLLGLAARHFTHCGQPEAARRVARVAV